MPWKHLICWRAEGDQAGLSPSRLPVKAPGGRCVGTAVGEHVYCGTRSAELAHVWSSIKSSPCYRGVSGPHKAWADLLAAVAARNNADTVILGQRSLETPSSVSDEELTLTTVMATAYLRMGQVSEARSLLVANWNQLNRAGEPSLALRELLALVQVGYTPGPARAAAVGSGGP